jgi:FtsP/CotA-like multicopper oxidase with cupredoxin domain
MVAEAGSEDCRRQRILATFPLRLLPALLLSACCLSGMNQVAQAAEIRGFTNFIPQIPNDDPDLILERVWEFGQGNLPTSIQFIPNSPKVLTLHQNGIIRLYESVQSTSDDYKVFLDYQERVYSWVDHGLTSMALHPDFGNGVNEAYVLYTGEVKDVAELPNDVSAYRPPNWGLLGPTETGFNWHDYCPNLNEGLYGGGDNGDSLFCEHPYYVDRLAVDMVAGTATLLNTLVRGPCSSTTTHGTGTLEFVGGDLVMSWGDGSQFVYVDHGGDERDGCHDPSKGVVQGVYRSQREDFLNGKVLRLSGSLVQSETPVDTADLQILVKGLRNPFRWHFDEAMDALYIGDVGYGDGGTTERIFRRDNILLEEEAVPPQNAGWPCIEGVYGHMINGEPGPIVLWDSPRERDYKAWAVENGEGICDGVIAAANAFDGGAADPIADPYWVAPLYEYRGNSWGLMDPDFPLACLEEYASITGMFSSGQDIALPEEYQGRLFFSDHTKKCVWYFDAAEDGSPLFTSHPHVLIDNMGVVDMKLGPDKAVYFIDHDFSFVARLYDTASEADMMPVNVEDVITVPPTTVPVDPSPVLPAAQCPDPFALPELEWTMGPDGALEGTLVMGPSMVSYAVGDITTRLYNNSIPGPLIRMKACQAYHLRVVNDLQGWGNVLRPGVINVEKDPMVTNLHLHGLHVSGLEPGDSVVTEIEPGKEYIYTYIIPCDHGGGTYWYHPHHHGSTHLHTSGGAAGVLLMEDNVDMGEAAMPLALATMPEAIVHIHEWTFARSMGAAESSGDVLFDTNIKEDMYSVNGCNFVEIPVSVGKWTRLRMLFSGDTYNIVVHIDEGCELQLLAKDGVYLGEVPRALPDNDIFFSLGSRVDVAVRCADEVESFISVQRVGVAGTLAPYIVGMLKAEKSTAKAATADPDLPLWKPCRPEYIKDAWAEPAAGDGFAVRVERDTINGKAWGGMEDHITVMPQEAVQQWQITGDDLHPLHMHINHMILGEDVELAPQQWQEIPLWHRAGDVVDVLSIPGTKMVRFVTDRFSGPCILHCHNSAHSDTGMMAVAWIGDVPATAQGPGDLKPKNLRGLPGSYFDQGGALTLKYGSCPAASLKPFRGLPAKIPGTVQAEEFDRGGLETAYWDRNSIHDHLLDYYRVGDWPEIQSNALLGFEDDGGWHLGFIEGQEWIKYTIDVISPGPFKLSLRHAANEAPNGMIFRVHLDLEGGCPAAEDDTARLGSSTLLVRVDDLTYEGTGSWTEWSDYEVPGNITVPLGRHTLTFCWDADAYMMLDSFSLLPVKK